MSKLLHLDAFSGVSGDMLVAALLDVGVPLAAIERAIEALPIATPQIEHAYVMRGAIRARRFIVHAEDSAHERSYREIRGLLTPLPDGVRTRAEAAFALLAAAEARVHGVAIDDVHFHEVGAIDSIIDIVAAAAALDHLDADVSCSPLPLGRGSVRTRHGVLPLPAPATIACLEGVPTYDGGIDFELVTPTGACLVRTAAARFVRWPSIAVRHTGYGAGARDLPDRANVLRVVLGDPTEVLARSLVLIETNVDDASPEQLAYALERAREEGARDAWVTPTLMKKSRAGAQLSVLADPSHADTLATLLMRETSTLGVRIARVERRERPRRMLVVETTFGEIPVKIADGDGLPRRIKPEHDACAAAARAHGAALDEVVEAARRAAEHVCAEPTDA